MKQRRAGSIFTHLTWLPLSVFGPQPGAIAASLSAGADLFLLELSDQQIPTPTVAICQDSNFSGLQSQCAGAYSFASSVLNYNATASADYGVLRAFAGSSIDSTAAGSGGPHAISNTGTASFRDQWSISGGEAGTTGTLELSFDIAGSYDFSMRETVVLYTFGLNNFTSGTKHSSAVFFPNSSGSLSYTAVLTTSFTFGEPLDFNVALTASSYLWSLGEGGYDGQAAFIDLSNTAVMNAIAVKDSNGRLVPFSLSTHSGAVLFDDLAATAVPVPPALYLLGSGLLGLIGVAKRKHAARKRPRIFRDPLTIKSEKI